MKSRLLPLLLLAIPAAVRGAGWDAGDVRGTDGRGAESASLRLDTDAGILILR